MSLAEKIIDKKRIYEGSYLSFERWEVTLPNQVTTIREIVIPRNAIAIVPVDHHRNLHVIRQSRIAVNEILTEIPAGVIDPDETAEEAARRELMEEIGFYPNTLIKLISYFHAEGYSTGLMTVFLGIDLEPRKPLPLDATEFLENTQIPFEEAVQGIQKGLFKDSKSILGIMLAQEWLSL